jgi:two-component SAPR family response regulator
MYLTSNLYIRHIKGILPLVVLSLERNHRSTNMHDNNGSIVVVDDEYDIANLVKKSLEVNGHKVCEFTYANAAFNHFISEDGHHHDIAISDIRMPGMNGYEFVMQVKKINPKVKVVLMSAFEIQEKEFHNMLPDIKVDAFLQKPFHIQQLNEVIEKISLS